MKIRTATTADLPRLAELWQEHNTILSQSDPRFARLQRSREGWLEAIEHHLNDINYHVQVAESELDLLGYIIGYIQADQVGIIDEIVLDAHTYYPGLGRGLWLSLHDWFNERNTEKIFIRVPRYHAVEQAFWRTLGAKEWKDETYKTPPEVMWMTL